MRDRALPARPAFEPVLAVAFLGLAAVAALLPGGALDPGSAVLLAVAIAASRVSPGGAITAGWFAVVLHVAGLVRGGEPALWGLAVAGAITVFGTSAYGTPAVRGWGLAVVVVLSGTIALLAIRSVFLLAGSGLPTPAALVLFTAAYLVAGGVCAALLTAAWVIGLTLRRRADEGVVRGRFETWLVDARPSLAAEAGRRRLVDDAIVAAMFFVAGWLLGGPASAADFAVLVVFAVAVAVRRHAPPIALGLAWLAALLQMASSAQPGFADIAVLAVLFTSSAYGARRTRLAGLASVGAGSLLATGYLFLQGHQGASIAAGASTWGSLAGLFVASVAVLGLAWTLGLLLRTWRTARDSRRQELQAALEHRAAQRTVVVEQERSRIARDMHDVVAHSLAVVIAQADGARYARATDATAVDSALVTISATARAALADVRVLLAQLRQDDAQAPQPTLADLGPLAGQMRAAGLRLDWSATGTPLALGSGAQLAVYRIVQEALTNALRHGAPGGAVRVALAWDATGLAVEVENAIDEAAADRDGDVGHGLPGMRERALLAGGALHAAADGDRFRVSARIPAQPGGQPAGQLAGERG